MLQKQHSQSVFSTIFGGKNQSDSSCIIRAEIKGQIKTIRFDQAVIHIRSQNQWMQRSYILQIKEIQCNPEGR